MRIYSRKFPAVLAVGALLATAACSGDDGSGGEGGTDEVVYLTSFANFGRDSYALVAQEKGFFEEEGIEVTINPGAGGENLTHLIGGQADFVVADITSAMFAFDQNDDLGVTAVAAVHQNTMAGLMTLESSGITEPGDLPGHTLSDAAGSVVLALFETYANLTKMDPATVEVQTAPPPDLPSLLAQGTVDVIGQFAVGEPLIENAAGEPAVTLPYSEYLTDLYGVVLFVRDETIEENPDLVRRFTSALMRGLEYALDNPAEAGELLAASDPAADAGVAARELELMAPFARPLSPGEPFGVIDRDRLARSIGVLEAAGAIQPGLTPEQLVDFDLVPGSDS